MARNACDKETIDRQVEENRDVGERLVAALRPDLDREDKNLERLACLTGNRQERASDTGSKKERRGSRPDKKPHSDGLTGGRRSTPADQDSSPR